MKKLLLISIGLIVLNCTPENDCNCERVKYKGTIVWQNGGTKMIVSEVSRYKVECQEPTTSLDRDNSRIECE